jgi:AhpD family alkylhydroperoxidase
MRFPGGSKMHYVRYCPLADDGFAVQFRLRWLGGFVCCLGSHCSSRHQAGDIKQVRSTFMEKNYIDITKRISGDLRKLRQDIPDTMKAFSALAQAAGRDGALDKKTKELIALAIAIAARCDGCIGFHMEALVRLGATRQEVEETLGMTIYMGGGPSLMYAADAISAFEEFQVQLGVAA